MKTHSKCADTSNPRTMTFRKLSPILAAKTAGLLILFLLGNGIISLLASFFTHKTGMGGKMILADDGSLLLTTTAFAVASIIGYVFVAAGAISLSWAKLSFRSERSISFGVPYLRVLHFAGCLLVAAIGLQWMMAPLHIRIVAPRNEDIRCDCTRWIRRFCRRDTGSFRGRTGFPCGDIPIAPQENRGATGDGDFILAFWHRTRKFVARHPGGHTGHGACAALLPLGRSAPVLSGTCGQQCFRRVGTALPGHGKLRCKLAGGNPSDFGLAAPRPRLCGIDDARIALF